MNKVEIEKKLAFYFKGVDADINVVMVGRIVYLDIQYVDFKPADMIRKELSALIPHIKWVRLERTYSKEAIMHELWRMYHEDTMMLIQTDDNTFHSTIFPIYVQERMETEQFTH